MYRAAIEITLRRPALAFRNPEKLEQGWELQRKERRSFVEFFGTDLVVAPGSEIEARMQAYMHFRTHEMRDENVLGRPTYRDPSVTPAPSREIRPDYARDLPPGTGTPRLVGTLNGHGHD